MSRSKSKRTRKTLSISSVRPIALILAIVFLCGLPFESFGASLRDFVQANQRRQAYGVYLKETKFGWAVDELKLGHDNGREVAIMTFEMEGSFTSGGERTSFSEKSTTVFEVTGKGEILRAEEISIEDQNRTHITAVRDGSQMRVTTKTKSATATRRIPLPKETLAEMQQLDDWLQHKARRGRQFTIHSSMWDRDDVDVAQAITFRARRKILWGGVKTEIYEITADQEGMLMQAEVLSDGTLIKGLMGGLFELRAEKESVAKQPGTGSIDMLQASSVPVDKDLGAPERVESATLELANFGDFKIPTSHRQRVRSRRGSTVVLELERDFRSADRQPLAAAQRQDFLKATPTLQSSHQKIRDLSKQLAGDEAEPLKVADRLNKWLYKNIRQTMAANASSALDVLENRAGDCTEISSLFVALSRAAGIPTREVAGVMFANDDRPIFGWHAWAEIHDGHQWVSVDPTWNQVYVDATHIKLAEGPNDWAWVNLLGRVRVKVISFKQR